MNKLKAFLLLLFIFSFILIRQPENVSADSGRIEAAVTDVKEEQGKKYTLKEDSIIHDRMLIVPNVITDPKIYIPAPEGKTLDPKFVIPLIEPKK